VLVSSSNSDAYYVRIEKPIDIIFRKYTRSGWF